MTELQRTFTIPDRLVSEFLAVHGGTIPGVVNLSHTANEMANVMLDQLPEDWPEDQVTITADPLHRHQHESWQVMWNDTDTANGPAYCAACGERVCGVQDPGMWSRRCILAPTGEAHLANGDRHRDSLGHTWREDTPSGETVEIRGRIPAAWMHDPQAAYSIATPMEDRHGFTTEPRCPSISHTGAQCELADNAGAHPISTSASGKPSLNHTGQDATGTLSWPVTLQDQERWGIWTDPGPRRTPAEDTPSADAQHEGDTPLEDTPQALDWRQMVEMGRVIRQRLEASLDRVLDPGPFGVPATWTPQGLGRLAADLERRSNDDRTMPRVAGWRAAWRGRR